MEYGFLSLIPPLTAIILALITKQTVFSLLVGLWIGTTIVCGWNPIVAFPTMISKFFIPLIANEWNAGMLMLIVSCGGFIYGTDANSVPVPAAAVLTASGVVAAAKALSCDGL